MSYTLFVCPIVVDPANPTERLVIEIEDGELSISEAVLTSNSGKAVVADRRSTISPTSSELRWLMEQLESRVYRGA